MHAVLRFHLRTWKIGAPRFSTPSPLGSQSEGRGHLGTMGIGPAAYGGPERSSQSIRRRA